MHFHAHNILSFIPGIFATLHLKGMISSILQGEYLEKKPEDVVAIVLFLVFMTGFVLSWCREYVARLCFSLWYFILIAGFNLYPFFMDSRPLPMLRIPMLVQGIFYVKVSRIEPKLIESRLNT